MLTDCSNCATPCEGTCTACCLEGEALTLEITATKIRTFLKQRGDLRAALAAWATELEAKAEEAIRQADDYRESRDKGAWAGTIVSLVDGNADEAEMARLRARIAELEAERDAPVRDQ